MKKRFSQGKQRIDGYARDYLRDLSTLFRPFLGDTASSGDGLRFTAPPCDLAGAMITNRPKKSLFGGVYSLDLIGEIGKKGNEKKSRTIRMGYEGRFVKGKAYFDAGKDSESPLVKQLNGDHQLISDLSELDLEKLEIQVQEDKYTVKMTPIGGSFLYMTFPPMKYPCSLLAGEVEKMCRALVRLSSLLSACTL